MKDKIEKGGLCKEISCINIKMNIANEWKDYEILDMANGEKLERWQNVILARPDPQIIWKDKSFPEKWKIVNAKYIRSNTGRWNVAI
jgi:hypothetical protein